jgi:hypothetical protein
MIVAATLIACAVMLAQGAAVWAFLRFVKSFGAYTESQRQLTSALMATHESNLLLHRAQLATHDTQMQMLAEVRQLHAKVKEVA